MINKFRFDERWLLLFQPSKWRLLNFGQMRLDNIQSLKIKWSFLCSHISTMSILMIDTTTRMTGEKLYRPINTETGSERYYDLFWPEIAAIRHFCLTCLLHPESYCLQLQIHLKFLQMSEFFCPKCYFSCFPNEPKRRKNIVSSRIFLLGILHWQLVSNQGSIRTNKLRGSFRNFKIFI